MDTFAESICNENFTIMNTIQTDSRRASVIHWIARILCIAAIAFIGMFSLDEFSSDHTLLQQIGGFLMHNIPTFILIAVLILSWKKELAGGILFVLLGLATTPWVYTHNFNMNQSVRISLGIVAMITLPFVIVGVLFIISYYLIHRRHSVA